MSAATHGLAPSNTHIGRPPRFLHTYTRGHRSLGCEHLEYCDLAADRQRRSCQLVREQNGALMNSRVHHRNLESTKKCHANGTAGADGGAIERIGNLTVCLEVLRAWHIRQKRYTIEFKSSYRSTYRIYLKHERIDVRESRGGKKRRHGGLS